MNVHSLLRSRNRPSVMRPVPALGRRGPVRRASTGRTAFPVLLVGALTAGSCAGGSVTPGPSAAPARSNPTASGEMTVVVDGGSYTSVSPARLTNMLKAKDFVLVNVHIPYEGEIDGTDRFIPYDQVANKLSDLPPAKNARILVYCRSGRMSTIAAKALVALGYTNVWELEGGMIAWEASGYQLVQRPQS